MNEIKIPILDLTAQYQAIQDEIQTAINRVLESGRFILGEEVAQFEQAVANYLGVKHAVGVNSGTDALIISLRSLGIGKGDEVITTPFSFFATAEAISQVGATPIFVDIEAESFNINPRQIIQKITPQTKAILPVHLYGNPAPMAQIVEIAKTYNLKILEDCAQSFGAKYEADCVNCQQDCSESMRLSQRLRLPKRKAPALTVGQQGKFTGTIGNMGAFSFFPTKNLGAYGDGGLVVTDDDQLAESARMLRVHGERQKYHNEMFGYNSRLDALQAAILRVKLNYIDQWNEQRRRVAQDYNQRLNSVENLVTPTVNKGHVFHQYTLRILGSKRDLLRNNLSENGIATMIYYPVSQDQLPVYQGQYEKLPVSESLTQEVLSLPMWPELSISQIDTITQAIKTNLA